VWMRKPLGALLSHEILSWPPKTGQVAKRVARP
jgi:hypothetical protein